MWFMLDINNIERWIRNPVSQFFAGTAVLDLLLGFVSNVVERAII
jgi:hypothetical protein